MVRFWGVNIWVFWKRESRPIEWRQCRPQHANFFCLHVYSLWLLKRACIKCSILPARLAVTASSPAEFLVSTEAPFYDVCTLGPEELGQGSLNLSPAMTFEIWAQAHACVFHRTSVDSHAACQYWLCPARKESGIAALDEEPILQKICLFFFFILKCKNRRWTLALLMDEFQNEKRSEEYSISYKKDRWRVKKNYTPSPLPSWRSSKIPVAWYRPAQNILDKTFFILENRRIHIYSWRRDAERPMDYGHLRWQNKKYQASYLKIWVSTNRHYWLALWVNTGVISFKPLTDHGYYFSSGCLRQSQTPNFTGCIIFLIKTFTNETISKYDNVFLIKPLVHLTSLKS